MESDSCQPAAPSLPPGRQAERAGGFSSEGAGPAGYAGRLAAFLQRRWFEIAATLVLFVAAFLLYRHAQQAFSGWIFWFNDRVFYSDTAGTYSHMKEVSFEGDMRKHPLFSLVTHPLTAAAKSVFGVGGRDAARISIALLAALNVSLVLILLRAVESGRWGSVLFTALYAVLFSNLVFFSIPETYSLSCAALAVFFLLATRVGPDAPPREAVLLGLGAGMASLFNPPLILLLIPAYAIFGMRIPLRKSLGRGALAAGVALAVYLGMNLLLSGADYFEYSRRYAGKWASPANLLRPGAAVNVGVSFLAFGVLSPLEELGTSIGWRDAAGYLASPSAFLCLIGYGALLGYSVARAGRRPWNPILVAAGSWIGAAGVFYIYFNPKEAFLYASQIQAAVVLLLAAGFESIRWKWKWAPATLLLAGVAWVNWRTLTG